MNPEAVCICTASAGPPNWHFTESIFPLRAPGPRIFRRMAGKQGVDDGHNRLIAWFLEYTDFDWMLHLDNDAKVHPMTLMRLLSWDVKFVSALAFQRKPPFLPVVYTVSLLDNESYFGRPLGRVREWIEKHPELISQGRTVVLEPRPEDALWEVLRGGAHCCLVHRDVFEAIEPPWFARTGPRAEEGWGSDFTFHRKARETGFKTYVDMSVVAGHTTGDLVIGALDFTVWDTVGRWDGSGSPVNVKVALSDTNQKED